MVCAITFATVLVITLLSLTWTTNLGRRSLALRTSVVNYNALVTYAAQWSGRMPCLVAGWSGWGGDSAREWASPLRYLQWAFTTPVLLTCMLVPSTRRLYLPSFSLLMTARATVGMPLMMT